MAEISGPETAWHRQLEEQMARLLEALDQQRADYEQQRADYEQRLNEQQAELADLRDDRPGQRRRGDGPHRTGRSASRRALLKWSGVAAAAAAVTLVASEQSAHAAPSTDGGNVVLGTTTTAEHQTQVKYDGTLDHAAVILLANDSTYSGSAATFPAALGGWVGDGTTTGGTSGNKNGVYGYTDADGGYGVVGWGTAGGDAGGGVYGQGGVNGRGVQGYAPGGVGKGVLGASDAGYAVVGTSGTGIDIRASGTGRIVQDAYGGVGAPTTGFHLHNESVRDNHGDLYLCVVGGDPGVWKKVAAIPADKPGGALVFLPKPFRLFDTRPGVAGCPIDPGVPMAAGAVTTLQVTGTASTLDSTLVVPTGATGIIGDLLAINVNGNGITGGFAGFLTLQRHNVTPTGNSFLHYYPATVQHNSVVIGLDAAGKLDVGNYNTSTNVGLDILGYII